MIEDEDDSKISYAGLPIEVLKTAVFPVKVLLMIRLFSVTVSGNPVDNMPLLLINNGAFAAGKVEGNTIE